MKKITAYISLFFLTLTIFSWLQMGELAFASDYEPTFIPKPETLPGPVFEGDESTGRQTLTSSILPNIAVGLIGFVGAASMVTLVIAGVRYSTTFGNDEAAGKAKEQIIYSIIGLAIAMLAYTIVTIVINLDFGDENTTQDRSLIEVDDSDEEPAPTNEETVN